MTMDWTGRRLDSIVNNDTTSSYLYDANGIRTRKTVGSTKTEYFTSGSTILAEKTGSDVIWYIYDSDGEVLGFTYNGTPYYYIKNQQGDVCKVVTASSSVVASYTYDAWGKVISASGSMAQINPIRYRSYYYDKETSLYYLQSRYYDPETGRFVSSDSFVSTGQDLLQNNMYAYGGNNPVNGVDSTGEAWLHWALGAVIVAACAVAVVVTAGGAAAGIAAVVSVSNGVAAATASSTIAAGAFLGSAATYGTAALYAANNSHSAQDFADQGNWGTVAYTATGTVAGATYGYAISAAKPSPQKSATVSRGQHTKGIGSPQNNANPNGSYTKIDNSGRTYSYTQFNGQERQYRHFSVPHHYGQ